MSATATWPTSTGHWLALVAALSTADVAACCLQTELMLFWTSPAMDSPDVHKRTRLGQTLTDDSVFLWLQVFSRYRLQEHHRAAAVQLDSMQYISPVRAGSSMHIACGSKQQVIHVLGTSAEICQHPDSTPQQPCVAAAPCMALGTVVCQQGLATMWPVQLLHRRKMHGNAADEADGIQSFHIFW